MAKRQWRHVISASLGFVVLQQGTGLHAVAATAVPPAAGRAASPRLYEIAQASGSLDIKLRRTPDSVEVVIEGTGPSPLLQQTTQGAIWSGRLQTAMPMTLRRGPVQLSLPEAGLQSISLQGSGNLFELRVSPTPGFPVGRPVVSADGSNLILTFNAPAQTTLQTLTPNVNTPGRVPQPGFIPPLQPRAVAPPLGDMAVGTMTISNPSYVNVSGPPVTMTLRNAPAKDVLMALSQLGGYGFVYVGDTPASGPSGGAAPSASSPDMRPISISFRREGYGRAINSALLAAGLQGKRDGNTIFAGPRVLSKSFGAQLSKVYRLNQVPANSAADYLANLGAQVTKTNTISTAVSEGIAATAAPVGSPTSSTTTSSTITSVESYGAANGPLVGLQATTDTRLSTITLVGAPRLVTIAEQYLKQMDLRQRQVALAVKILDVNLENDFEVANSFAFRWGNNFIVNDNGQLLGAFGRSLPPTADNFSETELITRSSRTEGSALGSAANTSSAQLGLNSADTSNLTLSQLSSINSTLTRETGFELLPSGLIRPIDSELSRSLSNATSSVERVISNVLGRNINVQQNSNASSSSSFSANESASSAFSGSRRPNPGLNYPPDNFFNFVQAQIVSRNSKLIASPTLILQENSSFLRESSGGGSSSGADEDRPGGLDQYTIDSPIGRRRANEAVVRVGTNVITEFETNSSANSGTASNVITCTPTLSTAGLVLGARVEKIDDNGFVTFSLSPSVSAVTDRLPVPGCGSIDILSVRRLDTGALRVRDGQTLILTGVISDFDVAEVKKWPILGDIPLIGQFFRGSANNRQKRELVIMVSPRIINDTEGGTYGYGYQPSTPASRAFLGGTP
ncbi:type II secretion system protein GspD [Cyanobium sp. La Preciosa 7G6]|uniref:type II secretion system protein GspD n=1 Tax=Cyanobium sp. La Preciosa 7G6 TaxID=2823715 RepID=UPI0020CCD5CA|nr:type II and III secretion system protein [Cyanobium sp. La Preciosa 7G6]MCP9833961.1 general secretion pathway protein D [Cyanobium sp. La Preciosa 7G6]MCP9936724.1 general secretion pathway protein D [Cyanobium sp. Aljojuca 7A6]